MVQNGGEKWSKMVREKGSKWRGKMDQNGGEKGAKMAANHVPKWQGKSSTTSGTATMLEQNIINNNIVSNKHKARAHVVFLPY